MTPCYEVPREYLFTYSIPNAGQNCSSLSLILDADGEFFLDEVVSGGAGYRVQFADLAQTYLQHNPVPLDDWIIDPAISYGTRGQIQIVAQDTSGSPGNPVSLLFRGRNKYTNLPQVNYLSGKCREDPRDYIFLGIIPASGLMENQVQDLDKEASFSLRQVIVSGGAQLQFADARRNFIQNTPIPTSFFGRPYAPQIDYPIGGQILIRITGTPGVQVQITFRGVNRYRVD